MEIATTIEAATMARPTTTGRPTRTLIGLLRSLRSTELPAVARCARQRLKRSRVFRLVRDNDLMPGVRIDEIPLDTAAGRLLRRIRAQA